MKRMIAKACSVGNTIILHYQSIHVSPIGICLIIFNA